jgi:hypothetical protein
LGTTRLNIAKGIIIREIQGDFNARYPFLKLEFYRIGLLGSSIKLKERVPDFSVLKSADLKNSGAIEIKDEMTVVELEKIFLEQFGLVAQVSRNSGGMWLETTMTDKWSLYKQNEYGREITEHTMRVIPSNKR